VTLSEAVLSLREDAEASQRDFARMLGVSLFSLQKYEGGRSLEPEARLLVALMVRALERSRSDLAAFFEGQLIAALDPPSGFEVTVRRAKGKRHE
jgi:hypothetical protein